jgi:hypothetical protein
VHARALSLEFQVYTILLYLSTQKASAGLPRRFAPRNDDDAKQKYNSNKVNRKRIKNFYDDEEEKFLYFFLSTLTYIVVRLKFPYFRGIIWTYGTIIIKAINLWKLYEVKNVQD